MFRETPSPALHDDWGYNAVFRLPATRHYKAIVLSDLHFPRRDDGAKILYEFLLHHTCDTLILLGDTHEGYDAQLGEFREMNLRVWDLIADRRAQGMRVIDVPGNHDSYKRRDNILSHKAFGTEYWNDLVVPSDLGDTYLFHGDVLDGKLSKRHDKLAYKVARKIAIGDRSLLDVHSALEKFSDKVWGGKGKKTNPLHVEFAAAALAQEKACTAVLTGHTHKASPFFPAENNSGILYGNTGAWVGGLATAMVMHHNGRWELIKWSEDRRGLYAKKPNGGSAPHLHGSFRDASLADLAWQKAQHSLYTQEVLVASTREALENVDRIRKRVQNYLKVAEEKLIGTREDVEAASRYANIERLEKPSAVVPILQAAIR